MESFIWKNTANAPTLSQKTRKGVEFIHCYEKKLKASLAYRGKNSANDDAPLLNSSNPVTELQFPPRSIRLYMTDGSYSAGLYGRVTLMNRLLVKNKVNANSLVIKGKFKWVQSNLDREIEQGTVFLVKSSHFAIRYQKKSSSNMPPDKYISDTYLSKALGVATNEDSQKHIKALALEFASYPKPESLLSFLIRMVTCTNDMVLDFFAGSGTTCAVAHKMGRRYIGIEQMDYIHDVTCERMKKVIDGEQGGISKAVNWQGGGAFVYCELAEDNAQVMARINKASSGQALRSIWRDIQKKDYLSYRVDPHQMNANIKEFEQLTLAEQKQFLIDVLDKNYLYVNYASIEDDSHQIATEDKKRNKQFYENGGD